MVLVADLAGGYVDTLLPVTALAGQTITVGHAGDAIGLEGTGSLQAKLAGSALVVLLTRRRALTGQAAKVLLGIAKEAGGTIDIRPATDGAETGSLIVQLTNIR